MSKRFSTSKKTAVGSKFDWHCAYCGRDLCWKTMCIDHVHPKSQGGNNNIENLFPCCRSCNSSKGTMSIDDFRLRTICHQKTDGVFFSLEQIKLLQNKGVWDFLGVNSDYLFFFEKFNGEAEHETF